MRMEIRNGDRFFVMGPKNKWSSNDYWFYRIRNGKVELIDKSGSIRQLVIKPGFNINNNSNYKEVKKEELPFYL